MSPADQRRRPLRVTVVSQTPSLTRAPGLGSWLEGVAPSRARGDVTVALVSDARMRALNRRFLGVNRATDVLSFPASDARPVPGGPLGEIVIAAGVARAPAGRARHSVGAELRVLALHGLLHLLGYDHETDTGRMARLEARLRRKGGLESGLIERAGRGA